MFNKERVGSNGSQNSIQCHSIEYWGMPYKVKPVYVRKLHWMKVWENNDNPCSGVKEKTSENDNEWAWLGSSNSDADSGSYLQSNHFFLRYGMELCYPISVKHAFPKLQRYKYRLCNCWNCYCQFWIFFLIFTTLQENFLGFSDSLLPEIVQTN